MCELRRSASTEGLASREDVRVEKESSFSTRPPSREGGAS